MKEHDVIGKETIIPVGHIFVHGAESAEWIANYMKHTIEKEYGHPIEYVVIEDILNAGRLAASNVKEFTHVLEAEVNWVVDVDMGITYPDKTMSTINLIEEPEWKVIREAPICYQSSVGEMSDEELTSAIGALRDNRKAMPKQAASRNAAPVDKNDPVAVYLASLSPEERMRKMKALGMIE